MTVFDIGIIVLVLLSGLLATARGFVAEMLSVLAWIIGLVVTLFLYPYVFPIAQDFFSAEWIAAVVTAGGIFTAVYLVASMFTYRWASRMRAGEPGPLDRALGLIFGAARGLIVIAIAYLFFIWLVPDRSEHPEWLAKARLTPIVESTALALADLMPDRDDVRPTFERGSRSETDGAARQSDADTSDGKGYKPSERQGLDQLFDTTVNE
ncbi:colicin V production protein [Tepidicaulis marinus]|uniref:Colicin V production protein n=1 Tax=Tepidicaulis marinus TaxID=1333998 RepID=A0A081BCK6_9HYPH|nr:CvpA family protein [Tepidicaulis marinus]GAK45774.1 colicin V production protein [Tepidicaulis marinus]